MNILDNELVLKYFSAPIALRILDAMQQPIRKGDRLLVIGTDSTINEVPAIRDHDRIHPFDLRLPDAFQKQKYHDEKHVCDKCGAINIHACKPTPSPEKCEWGCLCPNCGVEVIHKHHNTHGFKP